MSTGYRFIFAALLLALALPVAADKIYKWVDEDGKVHYSDTPPPDMVQQEHKILNEQGVTVEALERAKTPEEIEAERQAAMEAEEAARRDALARAEQERKDRILLSIYASEEDLFRARDHKLAAIDDTIELTRSNIQTQQESLEDFMKEAAEVERRGEEVGPRTLRAIEDLRTQMAENEAFIARKEQEKLALIARYAEELERFRELTTRRGEEHAAN